LERYLPGETRKHVRRFIATAYYFAVSGPVVDPVKPVVDPTGLASDSFGLVGDPAGAGIGSVGSVGVPGLMAAGLSDGMSEIGSAWRRNEPAM
ncbi:MAG TPA: hypothetical protein VKR41_05495, partial [Puia sp.]|nr:hypothetical protein [Puia sp.]